MDTQIFSQAMRTTAKQTWYSKQSFGFTKGTETMVQVGSIVDCGNSAINSPLLHPRALIIAA